MTVDNIRVLIVDDHQLMIEGLKVLLEDEESISKVYGANSSDMAFELLEKYEIDVVLMDVNMPKVTGIEATALMKEKFPNIKVVALTMHDDISIITKMIKAGASGYLLKRTQMNEVLEAIKTVYHNKKYLSNNTQKIIMDNLMSADDLLKDEKDEKPILSARELEVLKLIAQEFTNEEIGEKLFISERTVEAHRRNIFIKTKTKSIVGLMKYAIINGLITVK